jgi:hypothetical protein
MPSEERKSARNGIWLCSNCHDQVDRNVKTYTVEELKRLKHEGEKSAREQLGKPPPTTKQSAELPLMLDALAIHQIRQMKGQLASEDEEGVNEKAPALLQQLSGFQLNEDQYGVSVSREMLVFLLKLIRLAGFSIKLDIVYQVGTAVTDSVDAHGSDWTKNDVQIAVDISSQLAHSSLKSKQKPTEKKLIFERGISLLSHVIDVMKRVGGDRDERTCLAKEVLKTIQSRFRSQTRSRGRPVDSVDGDDDDSDGSAVEIFENFDKYTNLITKLAETDAPDAQFELESEILSLGFSYY